MTKENSEHFDVCEFGCNETGEVDKMAQAIVSAVNNTWLKDINPEAVPDLLEALKSLVEKCLHTDGYNQKVDELFQAQQAIQKATLTP